MSYELLSLLIMMIAFSICCFVLHFQVGISMFISALCAGLLFNRSELLHHLVEGSMSFIDIILVISCAMIFMKSIQASGALSNLTSLILKKFHKYPAFLLIMIMLIIMFPGMITGSSTAAVLSAGSMMAPILMSMGVPPTQTGAIVAMGGILGMSAPPVNIPAMIIGSGIDIPYVGFEIPLLFMTFPVAIFTVLYLAYPFVKQMDNEKIQKKLLMSSHAKNNFFPILLVLFLLAASKWFHFIPDLGMPLIFMIGSVVTWIGNKQLKIINVCADALADVIPVLAILVSVGMFIQIMTLTGVRGLIVTSCLSLDKKWLYLAAAISMPLFGAISSFGSASVFGVPFLLAFLSHDQIMTASALSLLAALGDMIPPAALAGIFAAKIVGVDDYKKILIRSLVPEILLVMTAVLSVLFANDLAKLLIR